MWPCRGPPSSQWPLATRRAPRTAVSRWGSLSLGSNARRGWAWQPKAFCRAESTVVDVVRYLLRDALVLGVQLVAD
eukprot:11191293-Lingulodinium_polyedra.AAC.1